MVAARRLCSLCGRRLSPSKDWPVHAVGSHSGQPYISELEWIRFNPTIRVKAQFEDGTSTALYIRVTDEGESSAWLVHQCCYCMLQSMSKLPVTPDVLLHACLVLHPDRVEYFPRKENDHHELQNLSALPLAWDKIRSISLGAGCRQECNLLTLPTEILLVILHELPSKDAVSFLSCCKALLKLAPLFWEPVLKYLPSHLSHAQFPDLVSLTFKLSCPKSVPRLQQTWDRELDCFRSVLSDLKSAVDIVTLFRNQPPERSLHMIYTTPEHWKLPGCHSSILQWPKGARRLRVFRRCVRGCDYVSGMQFISDVYHEIVGFQSQVYSDIPVSRRKHIVRFVIDELGIRSLNCGDDSSSGWSSGTPQSIRCWEGINAYEQSDGQGCAIHVILDAFKVRAISCSSEDCSLLGQGFAVRPFLPRILPNKEEFVQRRTLYDHRDDMSRTRGFVTADYLQFPTDMTGITMYMNDSARLYAMQIHSASNPQFTGVDNIDPLTLLQGPYRPTKFGGAQHFAIHSPDEYITNVTVRVLGPNQPASIDLGIEFTTNWDRRFLFGYKAVASAVYIYESFSVGNRLFDGVLFTQHGGKIHSIACTRRKASRRQTMKMLPPAELPRLYPPDMPIKSSRKNTELASYDKTQWNTYGTCARLCNLRHITWEYGWHRRLVTGLKLFYQDCRSVLIGKEGSICGKGFELLENETMDEIYLKWCQRTRRGKRPEKCIEMIEFRTSTGRLTEEIDNPSEWQMFKIHSDSLAAWWVPPESEKSDFHIFRLGEAVA